MTAVQLPTAAPPGVAKALMCAAVWITLNISLSLWNKWLFAVDHFRFPIYIIMTGLVVTFLCSALLLLAGMGRRPSWALLRSEWGLLLAASCSHGVATALENVSIEYISISLNQVIKATAPALTMACSFLFEGKRYRTRMMVITACLVVGAICTTFRNPSFDMLGFLASLASMLLGVMRVMINSRQLHTLDIDPIALTVLTALPAALSLVIPFALFELHDFIEFLRMEDSYHYLLVVLLMNFVAVAYIFSGLLLIKLTSAHYSQVIASLKVVLLVLISMQVFGVSFTGLNLVGLVVCFASFCLYSYYRTIGMEEKPPLPVLVLPSGTAVETLGRLPSEDDLHIG